MYTEKKDLIESKKIICLNDFLWFKEIDNWFKLIDLRQKFIWFEQIFILSKDILFESNKFCFI